MTSIFNHNFVTVFVNNFLTIKPRTANFYIHERQDKFLLNFKHVGSVVTLHNLFKN